MKIEIKNRFTDVVLYSGEHETMKEALITAVKADADLTGAYLAGANLAGAYLAGANLAGAYLAGANLTDADLTDADLAGADLTGANLTGADLTGAYLADADLTGANLADAYLAGAENGPHEAVPVQSYVEWKESRASTPRAVRNQERAARYRAANPSVPFVVDLDKKILALVETDPSVLDMSVVHAEVCGTTHCIAGHAVNLAGKEGYDLEEEIGWFRAGAAIYRASVGEMPHFFASKDAAISQLRRRVKEAEDAK